MEYPHWLMVAGAVFVVMGFIGLAFRKNYAEPVENNPKQTALTNVQTSSDRTGVELRGAKGKRIASRRSARPSRKPFFPRGLRQFAALICPARDRIHDRGVPLP
jgi:hypothetical protein